MTLLSSAKRFLAMFVAAATASVGMVAFTTTAANAVPSSVYQIEAQRNFVNGDLTIRPGETFTMSYSVWRYRLDLDALTAGDTIAVDLQFNAGGLTPIYQNWNWSINGTNSYYFSSNSSSTPAASNTLTWPASADAETINGFYVSWNTELTNSTANDVVVHLDPTIEITSGGSSRAATFGTSASEDFQNPVMNARTSETESSTYVAAATDNEIRFFFNNLCVDRNFAGDAIKVVSDLTADGAALSGSEVVSRNNSLVFYAGGSYGGSAVSGAYIDSYSIENGQLLINVDGTITESIGTWDNFVIENSGIMYVDGGGPAVSFDRSNARMGSIVDSNTIQFAAPGNGDLAETAVAAGAVVTSPYTSIFDGYLKPSDMSSVRAGGITSLTSPVAGKSYAATLAVQNQADGTDISRECGPAAPGAPVVSGTPTSSSISVTVPGQVDGATYYYCSAWSNGVEVGVSGTISESSRASNGSCQIFGLTASTTYDIKLRARSDEGTGAYSTATAIATTAASSGGGGGGGGAPITYSTFGSAPSGISLGSSITIPALLATSTGGNNRSIADWDNGVFIGSTTYGSTNQVTYTRVTPTGVDTAFGNGGTFTVPNATAMVWYGPANNRKVAFSGSAGMSGLGFATADANSDSTPSLVSISANLDAVCDALTDGDVTYGFSLISAPTEKVLGEVTCRANGVSVSDFATLNKVWVLIDPSDNSVTSLGSVYTGFDGTFYGYSAGGASINVAATGSDIAATRLFYSGESSSSSSPNQSYVYNIVAVKADGTFVPSRTVSGLTRSATLWPRFSGNSVRGSQYGVMSGPSVSVPMSVIDFNLQTATASSVDYTLDANTNFQNTIPINGVQTAVDMSMLTPVGNGSGSSVYLSRVMGGSSQKQGITKVTISGSAGVAATGPLLPSTGTYIGSYSAGSGWNEDGTNVYGYAPTSTTSLTVVSFAKSAIVGGSVTPPAPVKRNPTMPKVGTAVKLKKTITIALKSTGGTTSVGHNANGLITKITSKTAANCSVAVVKHKTTKKITGYTVTGKKKGTCKVEVKITGTSAYNAKTQLYTIKVS